MLIDKPELRISVKSSFIKKNLYSVFRHMVVAFAFDFIAENARR